MISYSENPISIRSKNWLTKALFDLMKDKPYEKISIREISEKAGLTRQTFYHNFSSKEMLLMYRSDQLFSEFYDYICTNNINSVEELAVMFFRYWQNHKEFLEVIIENNMEHILTHRCPDYFKTLDLLNVDDSLDETQSEYVYAFYSGALIYTLCKWVKKGMKCGPKEMASIVRGIQKGEFYKDERKRISNANLAVC